MNPPNSLDRFGDETGDPARGGGLDHVLDVAGAAEIAGGIFETEGTAVAVGVRDMADTRGGAGAEPPGRLSGGAHGQPAAAAVAVAEGDHFGPPGMHFGEQQGHLVGLGAGVGEEALPAVPGRKAGQALGEFHHGLVREQGGDVLEGVHLLVDRPVHLGMAVAEADGEDPAEEIEIAVAVRVPDVLPLAPDDRHGLVVEGLHRRQHVAAVSLADGFGAQQRATGRRGFLLRHGFGRTAAHPVILPRRRGENGEP